MLSVNLTCSTANATSSQSSVSWFVRLLYSAGLSVFMRYSTANILIAVTYASSSFPLYGFLKFAILTPPFILTFNRVFNLIKNTMVFIFVYIIARSMRIYFHFSFFALCIYIWFIIWFIIWYRSNNFVNLILQICTCHFTIL